jgi:hypothetical protein
LTSKDTTIMNLAASATSTQLLGSIGLGGLALVLALSLVLGTRERSEHQFGKGLSLTVGLAAGIAFMGAGQVWDLPDDLALTALDAAGVGSGAGPFGDVGMGAISILTVLVAYLVRLKPRSAGVLGIAMASVFTNAGGAWAMATKAVADFTTGLIS